MKKGLFALAAALMLLAAGCGGGTQKDIDPQTAADAILGQVDFEGELMAAEGDVVENFYMLDEKITGYAVYINSGTSTAEEVAVFKVADAADAKAAEDVVRARLDTLKAMFESYLPKEMVKLDNPVIETRGNVVYFVTANDPQQAKDAIESLYG